VAIAVPETTRTSLVRGLGLLTATGVVIGNVIGTGVFLKARVMTCNVGTPGRVVAVWAVAGLLSLAGALTYAELAAMMPRAGGEYVFIRQAYGSLVSFLFGWTRFFVASTGASAGLAAGFAIFINILAGGALAGHSVAFTVIGHQISLSALQGVAVGAVMTVTLINCAAVAVSGRIAFALTIFKIALLLSVGLGAMLLADGSWAHFAMAAAPGSCNDVPVAAQGGLAGFGAAMLGAMWAYTGWNEVTYVAEEVRNPQRNLPLAILGGLAVISALYVFVNAAYFYVLTPAEVRGGHRSDVARARREGSDVDGRRARDVHLWSAADQRPGLRPHSLRDGTRQDLLRRAGAPEPEVTRSDPRAARAGYVGQRTGALGVIRRPDRLRHILRPHLRRARDRVGVHLPPHDARCGALVSNMGIPGRTDPLPPRFGMADRQHAADNARPRPRGARSDGARAPVLLVLDSFASLFCG
jgi:hypothetical protein